ncbi:FtsX-like permease family protein [Nocardioides taihuensis]|uniref:FtsX-like permease family protein n=1 Tax=Nocardioides taihuensis TaxID=1835606 RepID=A0ABW0BHC1_9ACTN
MINPGGWRPLLRLAWRDALRARGRSALVLVMITLPVLAVTAATVVMATSDVSGAESLERRIGAADAKIEFQDVGRVLQEPDTNGSFASSGRPHPEAQDMAHVEEVLDRAVTAIPWNTGTTRVVTDKGVADAEADAVDLTDPLAAGLFTVDEGRLPQSADEVVVNTDLASRGFEVGDALEVQGGATYTVVGIGESSAYRGYPRLAGPDPRLAPTGAETSSSAGAWLVDAGDVTWPEVLALNELGAAVTSRAVLEDPPPRSEWPPRVRQWQSPVDGNTVAIAVLVVTMALLEVVLLAGPAFAVGARKRSRDLALMAASGATPAQGRRTILASGVVLGTVGAALGVVLGLAAGWAVLPLAQRYSGSWFGPYDVVWWQVGAVAVFGLASAVLAAIVPAWLASRQDVVAVLAGRRGDRKPGLRSPVLGVVLLGAGIALAAYGAVGSGTETVIAGAALLAVFGMILLVPVVLVGLARVSRRLPLVLRFAVRDASRHRTRTVPAVAAVAATVAGVVALGIANASDAAENEATYTPQLAMGQGAVNGWGLDEATWGRIEEAVAREVPEATRTPLTGIPDQLPDGTSQMVSFRSGDEEVTPESWGSSLGSSVLVADRVPAVLPALDAADRERADAVLADGGVVVFVSTPHEGDDVKVALSQYGPRGGRSHVVGRATVPATFIDLDVPTAPGQGVVSAEAAQALGAEPATVGLVVDGGVTTADQRDVDEAIAAITEDAGLYVERGYQNEDETVILLLVLGTLGGVLMLGGTLTATFLALSDARPDLATLAAVGASPRSRRGVAASYAVVVGFVGAVLGAAVGFVPGVAVTYPLTGASAGYYPGVEGLPTHYLDVPWALIGTLVVVLPLLTALVVGLCTRSRLPMVARLD